MTVPADTNKVTYTGDGATVSFSTSFTFASNDQIAVTSVVTATGVETAWTLGTQYTLTGAGTGLAGTLTVDTSPTDYTPASTDTLVIQLKPAYTQTTALPRGGVVSSKDTLEPMHDNRLRQILRLKDDVDRGLKVPITETSGGEIPIVALRKGYMLAFNATTGDPEVTTTTTADMQSGATDAAASAASAETAKTNAETAQTAAELAETNAETAQTAAETAQTNAETAETNAETAETNAAASAGALAFKYTFSDTTTMADPGAGIVRLNHATIGSATAFAFDATSADTGNPDISDYIATWDDSTNTEAGTITLRKSGAPATFAVFDVTGSVTDNTGWLQVAVTYVAGNGTLTDADDLYISFTKSGDAGAGSGDLLAANNLSDVGTAATALANIGGIGAATTDTLTGKTIDADGTGNVITNIGSSEVKSEMISGQTEVTIAAGDSIIFSDVDDSGDLKRDTVQGILDLASGGNFTLISTAVASAAATVDITFTPGDADTFLIECAGVVPASDGVVPWLRTSTDGGSTFDSGASNYQSQLIGAAGSAAAGVQSLETKMIMGGANYEVGTAAGESMSGWIRIHKPADTALYSSVSWQFQSLNSATQAATVSGGGSRLSAADIDAVQFLFSSGNVESGRFTLYKITHA
ncbi:hypothetical protein OAF54_00770 [bacterium]|nr:hypothetical protein [bacterium]